MRHGQGVYDNMQGCICRKPTEEEVAQLDYPKDKFDLLSVDKVYEWDQDHKYSTKEGEKHYKVHRKTVWITVRCKKCGTVKQVADNPRMGCKQGPCHQRFKDWTGKRVNRLTVLRYVKTSYMRNKKPQWYWECRCDCGRLTLTKESRLVMGLKVECDHCARIHNGQKTKLAGDMAVWHRMYRQLKRNALSRGYCMELSFDDAYAMMSGGVCHYCGTPPVPTSYGINALGIDRVDNTKGYTKENSVACCGRCNVMKMATSEKEFLSQIIKIAEYRKLTFNDYPGREYTQAGGNGEHLVKGEEIV